MKMKRQQPLTPLPGVDEYTGPHPQSPTLPPMSARLVLTGFPAHLEREFVQDNLRQSLNLIRFMMFASFMCMLGFGLVNSRFALLHVSPPWLDAFNVIRAAVIAPVALVCFLTTFFRKLRRFSHLVVCLGILFFSVGISGRIALAPREDPAALLYYSGLILVCLVLNVGVHIRFIHAACTGAPIILLYLVSALFFNPFTATPQGMAFFLNNTFFFLAAELIGLIACFFSEYYRRNAFLLQRRIRLEEQAARRRALDRWKEAYRLFREIDAGTLSKNMFIQKKPNDRNNRLECSFAEKVTQERTAELLDTFGARGGTGVVLDRIMDMVLDLSGARRGCIAVREAYDGGMVFVVRRGLKRRDFPFISHVIDDTLAVGEPLLVNAVYEHPDFPRREEALAIGIHSLFCFPVDVGGEAVGACYLDHDTAGVTFPEETDEMVISLVTQVILALQNGDWRMSTDQALIDEINFNARCETFRLTPREKELTHMVLQGLSNREIGERLMVTMNTLRSHLKSINSKVGATNRDELIRSFSEDDESEEPEAREETRHTVYR